ncbi:MAG TPA: ABC-F family ATP-binding cassette domain-containing protein [Haliscomenobacter sp.]|uniref:ABC-F family ATP-binding cassette domain-containing protein n=1 Tax=Haliscomenobacter sp. TaxID=2717303 RepID=UPI001DE8F750|nr:ABC-F family ATP-binding cassette domain-containing protein [Haliscomenobacter sp.]MBK9488324.1 ABC-F family ATP-binding cassette domain-containing protein [Haliscomenobacter sp.]HOY15677.1 ABC-F family ATP-binding cassette domain-containing protein [Haliscomenobacter sp.]
MNYLTLENVTKTYGEKVLFQNINLQVNKNQKVGLVAKNGSGKSTLLRVVAGLEGSEGESARVLMHRDARIGFLFQDPEFNPHHTIIEAALDADNPTFNAIKAYEEALLQSDNETLLQAAMTQMDDLKAWDLDAKLKELLTRFRISNYAQPVRTLSGGQKKRLALVRMILADPDFLILDEPTNHLDLDMIEWLEEYLRQPNLTILMVTHDRYFLERVCDQIVELDQGQVYKYSGNYSDFLEKKAARAENESIELDKDRKLLKKELDWVRRQPKARSTKAKSRVDSYSELNEKVSGATVEKEMKIDIKGQRMGKKVLELHNVGKTFGGLKIVEGMNYKFRPFERVGIVGPNGVGKTTFLKILTGEIRPDTGKVVQGDNTLFGYYTQDGIQLKEDKRVIDAVQDIAEYIPLEKGLKLSAAQLLERFLFSRKQQLVYVSQLSGGERRRLFLLMILMRNPNFLILDEPTNDLDILTLNILEDFLLEFPGCVIIVTHDRYFMDKVVEHLFVFEGDGQIRDFNGDYSEYREIQREREREQRRQDKAEQQKAKEDQKETKPGLSFDQRKEMNRLEKEIQKLEEKKTQVADQFNRTDLKPEDIKRLSVEINQLSGQIEEKEGRWMELAELA